MKVELKKDHKDSGLILHYFEIKPENHVEELAINNLANIKNNKYEQVVVDILGFGTFVKLEFPKEE